MPCLTCLQPRKRPSTKSHAVADAGPSMDAGHQEQKGQHGQLHQTSMGMDRLGLLFFFSSYPCRHIHPFSINKPSGCAHSTLSRILLENMKCHDPLLTCMMLAVHVCCCTNRTNSSQMALSFSSHNWALSFWFLNVIYLVIDLFFAEKYQYTLHMYIHG